MIWNYKLINGFRPKWLKSMFSLSSARRLAVTQPSEYETQNPFPTFTLFPLQLNQTFCFPSSHFLEFPPFSLVSCLTLPERRSDIVCNKQNEPHCTNSFPFSCCFLILFLLFSFLESDFELFIDSCLDKNKGCICWAGHVARMGEERGGV